MSANFGAGLPRRSGREWRRARWVEWAVVDVLALCLAAAWLLVLR